MRRGVARSLRVAGPVPTVRRAVRLAVDVDVRPDARVEGDRPDDDDRVEDERDEVRADDERDDVRADDERAEDDDAERVDETFADVRRGAADEREDDVRAERVVDRAGERPDPLARVPPPPEDERPDPLREVTAWPPGTASRAPHSCRVSPPGPRRWCRWTGPAPRA